MASAGRYRLIVAEPCLCVAACISMILESSGYITIQSKIASKLGVKVPQDAFPGQVPSGYQTTECVREIGIKLDERAVNRFLEDAGFAIRAKYFDVRCLLDWQFEDCIREAVGSLAHVICGYDYDRIDGRDACGVGHAAIVASTGPGERVLLFDPGPRDCGVKEAWITDLRAAALAHDGGVMIFR